MILEKLHNADLHDAPVRSLSFDFEKRSASFVFDLYDDLHEAYVPIELFFTGVDSFVSRYPEGLAFEVTACNRCRGRERGKGGFEAKFIFETGPENIPGYVIEIGFTGLETRGGLAPEALAHREAYFRQDAERRAGLG